jgi:hypothetical protein
MSINHTGAVRKIISGGFIGIICFPLMVLAHPVDFFDFPPYEEPETVAVEEAESEEVIDLEQTEKLEIINEIVIEQSEITQREQLPDAEVSDVGENESSPEPLVTNARDEEPASQIKLNDKKKSDQQLPLGRIKVATRYFNFGFLHILPKGLDHILFVLALFLLSIKFSYLLWQVTAFTIAHSITLGLSIYGYVSLSSAVVEPLIAVSIVFVAFENLMTTRLNPWRPVIVFIFGLLHGLGFAGVLSELGLPRGDFLTALVTFNLGVELGQLTVIGSAYLLIGWFIKKTWYRKCVIVPASLIIAITGAYWTFERVFL